jgi:hypothetical protein
MDALPSWQRLDVHVRGFVLRRDKVVAEHFDFDGVAQGCDANEPHFNAGQDAELKQALLELGVAANIEHARFAADA